MRIAPKLSFLCISMKTIISWWSTCPATIKQYIYFLNLYTKSLCNSWLYMHFHYCLTKTRLLRQPGHAESNDSNFDMYMCWWYDSRGWTFLLITFFLSLLEQCCPNSVSFFSVWFVRMNCVCSFCGLTVMLNVAYR